MAQRSLQIALLAMHLVVMCSGSRKTSQHTTTRLDVVSSPTQPSTKQLVEAPLEQSHNLEKRRFEIMDDRFWRDGRPVQIISGSIHYFRIHPHHWRDRLIRAKSLGLNAIQTYIPWNFHQPSPGVSRFTEHADFPLFLHTAQSLGLMVLLRVGPYVCGEWEFGGFPGWLLGAEPKVKIRSEDPAFLAQVDAWWDVLLPLVKPLLWANGGPVVMVQVENELGFYASVLDEDRRINTAQYLRHLVRKARSILGEDTILYTTDSADPLIVGNGTLRGNEVYTVIDAFLENDYETAFAIQRAFNAPGMSPPLTSEFYTGWFSTWGEPLPEPRPELAEEQIWNILAMNASINFYMAVGGTNFEFTSGANIDPENLLYKPLITSYDYSAPIGEAGEMTSPYYKAARDAISSHLQASLPEPPPLLPRMSLPRVKLTESARLLDVVDILSVPTQVEIPKSMETFNQSVGFILYSTRLPSSTNKTDHLTLLRVRDRAHVFLAASARERTNSTPSRLQGALMRRERRLLGTVERWLPPTNLSLPHPSARARAGEEELSLEILVENLGRVNFGKHMEEERKGMDGVLLGSRVLRKWKVHTLTLSNITGIRYTPILRSRARYFEPTFFRATFQVPDPEDTFMNMRGWGKGMVWVNGANLGRYWPKHGPQGHLYVPGPFLKKGTNELVVLELDLPSTSLSVTFQAHPDFSCGPVPLVPPVEITLEEIALAFLGMVMVGILGGIILAFCLHGNGREFCKVRLMQLLKYYRSMHSRNHSTYSQI